MTPTRISVALACLAFAVFCFWYASAPRLTQAEVDGYIAAIERQPPEVRGDLDVAAFRRFLEADDGRPFYNVNLFKFRPRAAYPAGRRDGQPATDISGEAAFGRYATFMLETLPRRACHGVFLSTRSETPDWDVVATVRYRSRRDIAELFVSPEFTRAVVHKWAALLRNERVPVLSRGLFATAYLPLAALLTTLVLLVHAVDRLRPAPGQRKRRTDSLDSPSATAA